jgi:hypothetical protein
MTYYIRILAYHHDGWQFHFVSVPVLQNLGVGHDEIKAQSAQPCVT